MLTKKPMVNQLSCWVQVINNYICIARVTSSKNDHLKVFIEGFQDILSARPNVYSGFNNIAGWKLYWQFNLISHIKIFITVDKSFVQIKNYGFFIFIKVNLPSYPLLFGKVTAFLCTIYFEGSLTF